MSRHNLVLLAIALAAAALFVRLGLWQLDRRADRRAVNAVVAARRAEAPVPFDTASTDTARARFRRVQLAGAADYANEFVLTGRTRDGSPGVHLLTPVRPVGTERAILVNRGWVYSPDGARVERARWREEDILRVDGYIDAFAPPSPAPAAPTTDARAVRRLDFAYISQRIPYPIAPVIVVMTSGDSAGRTPVRGEAPALDEGPHLGYAVQWFSFAVIAVVGAFVLVRAERAADRRRT